MSGRKWIDLPRVEGEVSRQAHADLPPGTFEREFGCDGFFGPATHLFHRHPPTGWQAFEGALRPRAFDAASLATSESGPFAATALLSNANLRLRIWRCEQPMAHLARNADGDELIFVHEGQGAMFCDFGHLSFSAGDYIVLPRG